MPDCDLHEILLQPNFGQLPQVNLKSSALKPVTKFFLHFP